MNPYEPGPKTSIDAATPLMPINLGVSLLVSYLQCYLVWGIGSCLCNKTDSRITTGRRLRAHSHLVWKGSSSDCVGITKRGLVTRRGDMAFDLPIKQTEVQSKCSTASGTRFLLESFNIHLR